LRSCSRSSAYFPTGGLRGEGFTDHFATPLHFTNGDIHVASWAARQPAGFSDEDVPALTAVARPLARLVEIRTLRRTEATLLETYKCGWNLSLPPVFRVSQAGIKAESPPVRALWGTARSRPEPTTRGVL